jgi:CheY-like chemotaxis protein
LLTTILAVVNDLIQHLGYNALVASNGVDELEILRRNPDVTVLFSDISMPGMNGEELARAAAVVRPGCASFSLQAAIGGRRLQRPLFRSQGRRSYRRSRVR